MEPRSVKHSKQARKKERSRVVNLAWHVTKKAASLYFRILFGGFAKNPRA